jgi:hypothetical protein
MQRGAPGGQTTTTDRFEGNPPLPAQIFDATRKQSTPDAAALLIRSGFQVRLEGQSSACFKSLDDPKSLIRPAYSAGVSSLKAW